MLNRRQFAAWCAASLLGAHAFPFVTAAPPQPQSTIRNPQVQVRHRFLALDAWGGRLWHIDQFDPSRNGCMTLGGLLRDMQLIGSHRLLTPDGQGFRVYDLESKALVERVQRPELGGAQSARRLPDGTTLLGANLKQGVAVLELDPAHKLIRTILFPQLKYLRLLRRTPDNTLLLADWDGCAEVTIAPGVPDEKRVLRRFALPRANKAFMALRKPDGHTLVAGGYAAGLFEYAPDGRLLREFRAEQPAGMQNFFYAGLQLLPNGHIVQANWNGHNKKDYHPGWKLIEFDAEGKVVWHWFEPPEKVGAINSIIILDHVDPAVLNDDAQGTLGPLHGQ